MPRYAPATALALLAATLALTAGCIRSSPEKLLADARAAAEAADYRTASIHLKTLLQREPRNPEAVLLLAEVALAGNNPALAERNFRRAGEMGVEPERYWLDWVDSLLQLGSFADGLTRLEERQFSGAAAQARASLLAGRAHAGLGDSGAAEAAFRRALALNPALPEVHLDLARLYALTGRDTESDRAVAAALALDGDMPAALLWKANRLLAGGRLADAEPLLIRARKAAAKRKLPDLQAQALTALAEVALASSGRLDEAARHTSDLAILVGEQASVLYLRARLALERGDMKVAKQQLQETLARSSNYLPAQRLLGAIHVLENEFDVAEMYLRPVVAANPNDYFARRLLATVHLARNRPAEALPLLDRLTTGDAVSREALLAMMGQANLQVGDVARAIEFFQQGSASFPDNPVFELGLALTMLAEGRSDDALMLLRQVRGGATEATREAFVTIAYMQKGDAAAALDSARGLVARHPDAAWCHNLLGSVLMASGQFAEARQALTRAMDLDPQDMATLANLARVEQLLGNPDVAAGAWRQILAREPGNADAGFALAKLELDRGNVPAAMKVLEPLEKNSSRARLLLAAILVDRGSLEEARRLVRTVQEQEPENPEAWNLAGLVALDTRALDEARQHFRRATELKPDVAVYRLNLARAALAGGDLAEAARELEEAGRREPDSPQLRSLQIVVALRKGDQPGARALLDDMNDRGLGEESLRMALAGEVATAAGDAATAASQYAAAYGLRPSLELALKAYSSQRAAGQPGDPALVEDWANRNPDDWRSQRAAADAFFAQNRLDRAEFYYEKALARAPRDLPSLNNLAWIFQGRGDVRALRLSEQAVRIAGEDAAVLDTAGWIQLRMGDKSRGLGLLQKAAELDSQDPDIRYHLAAALVETGQAPEGRRMLEQLLAAVPEFTSRPEAEQLLARL